MFDSQKLEALRKTYRGMAKAYGVGEVTAKYTAKGIESSSNVVGEALIRAGEYVILKGDQVSKLITDKAEKLRIKKETMNYAANAEVIDTDNLTKDIEFLYTIINGYEKIKQGSIDEAFSAKKFFDDVIVKVKETAKEAKDTIDIKATPIK